MTDESSRAVVVGPGDRAGPCATTSGAPTKRRARAVPHPGGRRGLAASHEAREEAWKDEDERWEGERGRPRPAVACAGRAGRPHRRRRRDPRPRGRARRAGRAPATCCCSPATSAPARPPSPRASAAASASTSPITSPTFTLAREYQGARLRLHHLDVYRIEAMAEVFDVDLPELLDDDAVVLIEWGEAIAPAVPADYLEVALRLGDGDDDRVLELRAGRSVVGGPR